MEYGSAVFATSAGRKRAQIDINIARESAGRCIHEVCVDCKAWNPENIALMRAAHEAEEASVDQELQAEESSESENEHTEEYSYEGDSDEHSYGDGVKEEVEYSTFHEEGDDYSLYEPPSDDDSD